MSLHKFGYSSEQLKLGENQELIVHNLKFMSTPGQVGIVLNENEINNILNGLDQTKITLTSNIIQLLNDKGLFEGKVWKNNTYFRWRVLSFKSFKKDFVCHIKTLLI